jgi:hypothetical protein
MKFHLPDRILMKCVSLKKTQPPSGDSSVLAYSTATFWTGGTVYYDFNRTAPNSKFGTLEKRRKQNINIPR